MTAKMGPFARDLALLLGPEAMKKFDDEPKIVAKNGLVLALGERNANWANLVKLGWENVGR